MDWLKVTTGNVVTRPRSFSVSMTQCDKPVSFHSRVFYVRGSSTFSGSWNSCCAVTNVMGSQLQENL